MGERLRGAFASEVAARLPGMQSAAATLIAGSNQAAARELMTHAHTLASSAAILGEDLASEHARRCEELITPYCSDHAVVTAAVAAAVADEVETVGLLLAPWLVGGAA